MTDLLQEPDFLARIDCLVERIGYDGPDARENLTKAERAERMQPYVDFGVAYREQHPYDDDNPPSKVWQDELYDENGLPK